MPVKKKRLERREILLYIFFGALTTLVSFASYFLFRWIFPWQSSSPAVALSWICAVTFAFVTNKLFVFKSAKRGKKIIKEAGLFYAARVFTLVVDLVLMFLLVDLSGRAGGFYELAVRVGVSGIVLILNYVLSKVLVFKRK